MNNFLQFELWKDCDNKCTFCFNDNSATPKDKKVDRLQFILEELDNPRYTDIEKVGLIGGEIFGECLDNDLFSLLIQVMCKICFLPNIKKVYMSASLLTDVSKIITLSNLFNKDNLLLICTSWDTFGRFHTKKHLEQWEDNIKTIHRECPIQQVHVEIIPTQRHIQDVLADKFNIREFMTKYQVSVDYCTPCSGFIYKDLKDFEAHVPGFFPKRSDFLKFLYKVYSEGQARPDMFTNYDNMSTLLWMELNGKYRLVEGYRGPIDGETVDPDYPLPPMHADKSEYLDSEIRMRKDVLDVWRNLYE